MIRPTIRFALLQRWYIIFCLIYALTMAGGCHISETTCLGPNCVELVWRAAVRLPADTTPDMPEVRLGPKDLAEAAQYVRTHPDFTSYHLLLTLRKQAPLEYSRIPVDIRAAILCDALIQVNFMNDWGSPLIPFDGPAAEALLETGRVALQHLRPLLDNKETALCTGIGAEAFLSRAYRRNDYAYRYAAIILGLAPTWDPDPQKRDAMIAELKRQIPDVPGGM